MTRPTTTESTNTRDAYSATHNWTNQYADWRDSTGTQQGSSAWSGASVTVSATGLITIDVTSIVQASGGNWFGNADRVCALLLKSVTAGSANFTANENATSANRPKIKYIGGTNSGVFQDVNVATFYNTATSSPLGTVDPMELAGSGTGLEKRIFIECPPPVDVVTSAILQMNCTFTSGSPVITAWQVDAGDAWTSGAPTAPTSPTETLLTDTTVRLGWTDASSTETGFKVRYRVVGAGSWTTPATTAANAVYLDLTGLTASTQYEWQVAATNGGGDSAYTTLRQFWTDNPVTGDGDMAGSTITIQPPSASLLIGQTRRFFVKVQDPATSAPVAGYTPTVTVLTAGGGSVGSIAATDSLGVTYFDFTASASGQILVSVL